MATSSFSKQFTVPKENADAFVREMTKPATPTLTKDFHSQLRRGKDLKEKLQKALN